MHTCPFYTSHAIASPVTRHKSALLSAAKALPANSKLPRFAETTLRTPPMIVRYVKPKFLHEVIPPEKGFKKSLFQMLKFW